MFAVAHLKWFRYCQNMETAQHVLKNVGENHSVIQSCQRELSHQLPLSSYLLKPVQRLTKYQLILKQLTECSPGARLHYLPCFGIKLPLE